MLRRFLTAVGLAASAVWLPADALDNWTYRSIGGKVVSVAYGHERFVAVGGYLNEPYIALSTNGSLWTQQPFAGVSGFIAVCFGDGKFVALSGAGHVAVSTNGTFWESSLLPDNVALAMTAITHGGGRFVAVGSRQVSANPYDYRAVIYSSTNGVDWTNWMSTAVSRANGVAYGNGKFVVVGGGYNTHWEHNIHLSTNGVDWTPQSSPVYQHYAVAFGGGQFVASTGARNFRTSADGETWATQNFYAPNVFAASITYGNGTFVAVGSQDQFQHTVLRSEDGTNWQVRSFGPLYPNSFLTGVAFGADTFVAVGTPQNVLQSGDVRVPSLKVLSAGDPRQLRVAGKIQTPYRLQSSTDLNDWQDVTHYTIQTPTAVLSIPATNTSSRLFFRAVSP